MSKKKIQSSQAPAPKAYLYIRFSTAEQQFGDSETRQRKLAREYCERKGIVLDESVILIDRGVSAFRGKNQTHGALSKFYAMVTRGEVARGSLLIVEAFDRMDRQQLVDSLSPFLNLVTRDGIEVQTLVPEQRWDAQTVNSVMLISAIVQKLVANEESQKKAERLSEVWARKRQKLADGIPITKLVPEWIVPEEVTKLPFKADKEAAKTINQIFKWRAQGIGVRQIVLNLNDGTWWKPRGRRRTPAGQAKIEQPPVGSRNDWRRSYVNKILVNRAVMGEYQPHRMEAGKRIPEGEPIKGYFPQIVAPALFAKVQKKLQSGKGGQTGKFDNVLRYLCRCAYCGGSMTLINKGKPPKGAKYLACETGTRSAKCERHQFRYDQIETLVLENCPKLDPSLIIPSSDEIDQRCQELRESHENAEAEVNQINEDIVALTFQVARAKAPSLIKRYEATIDMLEKKLEPLTNRLATLKASLEEAESSLRSVDRWQAELVTLRKKIAEKSEEAPMFRQKLNGHLRDLVSHVETFSRGYTKLLEEEPKQKLQTSQSKSGKKRVGLVKDKTPPRADDIHLYADAVLEEAGVKMTPQIRAFIDNLAAKRLSKAGRFIRLHFQSGKWVDLVPPGSLACGHYDLESVDEDGRPLALPRWKYRAVNVLRELEAFLAQRKPEKRAKARKPARKKAGTC